MIDILNRLGQLTPMNGNLVAYSATHRSVGRALKILDAFSLDDPELRLADLVQRTGEDKSTLSRLIKVLEDAGFIRRSRDNTFSLALKFVAFAEVAKASFDLSHEAEPVLRELRDESRGTVALRVLEGNELVTVALLESREPMRVSHPVGGRTPYNFGSYGKAVMAFSDADELNARLKEAPLHAFTPRTITNPQHLRKALTEVRRHGYAFSDEEGLVGARAIAAPVWGHRMKLIGALGASFPKVALDLKKVARCGGLVKAAAQRLSIALGGHPPKIDGNTDKRR